MTDVLTTLADSVLALPGDGVRRIGVDGVDGAGKTVFADRLGQVLHDRGTEVIRASVDGFHHPRAVRHRRGRDSPDGFYLDSYDYPALRRLLLDPLAPGGSGRFVRARWDVRRDRPVAAPQERATPGAVLVFDGIFLHRPELRDCWDLSVFLDVDVATAMARVADRDGGDPDPAAPSNRRYVEGQRRYLRECAPRSTASVVVDNTDPARPVVVHSATR